MDKDLENISLEAAKQEIMQLRDAIRYHMTQKGHDRCWLDNKKLYAVLPEGDKSDMNLPPKEEFLHECNKFWENNHDTSGD